MIRYLALAGGVVLSLCGFLIVGPSTPPTVNSCAANITSSASGAANVTSSATGFMNVTCH